MSKVSIIIPAFNQARFLAVAIDSALQQTYRDVEVIVVDDGSTDETRDIAARFGDRITYVHQENTGLPGARNRGWRESGGEYLCFLDSDDFYHPEKVQRQVELLDADPQLGFVYCDIVTTDEAGQPVPEQPSVNSPARQMSGNIFQTLMMAGYFPPHTVMIRRSVLEAVGEFDPSLGGNADYELWLRASAAGHKACFIDERLAYYRTYPTSMSKDGLHMIETRLAAFQKICRLHPDLAAQSIHHLQQSNQDLFLANAFLNQNWEGVMKKTGPLESAPDKTSEQFSLLKNVHQASLARGSKEQLAVWDVTLNEASSQAIFLQPPAELLFTIPFSGPGKLSTAIAIHPEAWNKPKAGGCEFYIRVDGRVALVAAIDPVSLPGDRGWFEIKLDIPQSPSGEHQITLETRAIGNSVDYRWALWREPKFTWQAVSVASGVPPIATALVPAGEVNEQAA